MHKLLLALADANIWEKFKYMWGGYLYLLFSFVPLLGGGGCCVGDYKFVDLSRWFLQAKRSEKGNVVANSNKKNLHPILIARVMCFYPHLHPYPYPCLSWMGIFFPIKGSLLGTRISRTIAFPRLNRLLTFRFKCLMLTVRHEHTLNPSFFI